MFKELKVKYDWRPISGCPGRYTFAKGIVALTIQQLTDSGIEISEEVFQGAADPVDYCYFNGGGLISYRKNQGYLHTLCDEEGMKRKMAKLRGD
jgi:hypothetical protein